MLGTWNIQILLREMLGRGDHPAVMAFHNGRVKTYSYFEIGDQALRLAFGLRRAGVETAEPIVVLAPNKPEWAIASLAIGAAGAVMVPIDDLATDAEIAAIVTDSGCRRAFTTIKHLSRLAALPKASPLELFVLDNSEGGTPGGKSWRSLLAEQTRALPTLQAGAAAGLFYTSGTTGTPKAFTLTHGNLSANVLALLSEQLAGPDDRLLLPLPLHHVYPYLVGLLTPFASGATVVLPEGVAGPQILNALRVSRARIMLGVPRLYEALLAAVNARISKRGWLVKGLFTSLLGFSAWLRRRLRLNTGHLLLWPVRKQISAQLRLLVSGGAKLEPAVISQLRGLGWEVLCGYGLAETASLFTANLPGRKRLGSEGKPLGGGAIRIAGPDEKGIGEIQVRGPNVCQGYRNNPEANRAAFTADGWFRTGDLGFLDGDGYLYVTGRSKEMIVLGGGKNIFPEALERAYQESRFVREIAILEYAGTLVALVRPNLDALKQTAATNVGDAVRVGLTEVAQRLPSFQRLAGYAITYEALPRTRLGKVRRFLLPAHYERALAGGKRQPAELSGKDRAFLADPPASEIWRLLKRRYPDQALTLNTSPQLDLGVDSLEWITLSLELSDQLGIHLTEEDIARIETLRDLVQAVIAATERKQGHGETPLTIGLAPEQQRWLAPTGPALHLAGIFLYSFNWLFLRLFFPLRIEGRDALPAQGPYVIAANHTSYLDGLALAAALPLKQARHTYWAGDAVLLFANPVSRLFCHVTHIFPANARAPAATLAMASAVLSRGDIQTWFPEMWRSPDGKLQRFLPGIGMLLTDNQVPVVPVHISGTFEALPRNRRWPRRHAIRLHFGHAVNAQSLMDTGVGGTAPERIANALHDKVAILQPHPEN